MLPQPSAGAPAQGTVLNLGPVSIPLPPLPALAVPVLMGALLAMMVLPLPAVLLDLAFSFNIAMSLVVLVAATSARKPLEFSVFPTVLLVTTLLRLSLNVASTRAVLLHGHTGTDAAGKVIEAFAHFLIGGELAVGIIVFAILTVINFAVVTKGAGRIAEVSARFALDAMPGKQMAIDADLNAGLLDERTARARREEVGREADFHGAMDGASKFVRGDAVAGIVILFINALGGLAIGVLRHDLSFERAANNYVLLAIGDALVAQIPALVISVAAGLVISRIGSDEDVGASMARQLLASPRAFGIAGTVLGLLGMVPGMPHVAFLGLAGGCGWAAWKLANARAGAATTTDAGGAAGAADAGMPGAQAQGSGEASWDDVAPVDLLGLELGYRLIPLVDQAQGGDLLGRIRGVRRKFAGEVGFLPPAVRIRDELELRPTRYRILLKGVSVGEADAHQGRLLAINPGHASLPLPGEKTTEPAFGLPATWIDASMRDAAQTAGYTVVDCSTVIATHLHTLMQTHASRLLGRAEVQSLLEHLGRYAPKLADDVVPKLLPVATVQRVLQGLLDEAVHLRDLRTIFEALADAAPRTQDPGELLREVRVALGPSIVQAVWGAATELDVVALEPSLEQLVGQALAGGQAAPALEPGVADLLVQATVDAAAAQEAAGLPACLLVPERMRLPLGRLLRKAAPRLRVLAHGEIPDHCSIRIGRIIGEPA